MQLQIMETKINCKIFALKCQKLRNPLASLAPCIKMSFFCCFASFLLAVWFCIYTHAQLRVLKFQDSVYQKAEFCAQTINE